MLGGAIGVVGIIFIVGVVIFIWHFVWDKLIYPLILSIATSLFLFTVLGILMNLYYTEYNLPTFLDDLFGIRDKTVGYVMMVPLNGWVRFLGKSGVAETLQGLKEITFPVIWDWIKSLFEGWW